MDQKIKEFFKSNQDIRHKDIILFFGYYNFGFRVREVIDDLEWKLEAYYVENIGSHEINIVFMKDIISPRTKLSQNEFYILTKKIIERKEYVEKNLQPRDSTRHL